MKNTAIIGLLVLVMIFSMTVSSADAETSSPLQQFKQGIPINEIQCNDSKILLESPQGKPACVKDDTAKKLEDRGWEIIQHQVSTTNLTDAQIDDSQSISIIESSKDKSSESINPIINRDIKISDRTITISTFGKTSDSIGELGPGSFWWPKLNMTFPEQVLIGEPFEVVLDYTYVIPAKDDDEFGVEFDNYEDPDAVCLVEVCERQDIWIGIPTYVDYLNATDAVHETTVNDTRHIPTRTWNSYSINPPFDTTKYLQETFTFVVNKPDIDYQYGFIDISFHGAKEAIFYFNAAQDGIVYFDDELMQSLGEGPGQLRDTPLNGTAITREMRVAAGPVDGPPVALWEEFKDHMLEMEANDWLHGMSIREALESNPETSQSWIDRFLKFYPELDTQSFNPTLHWILPQAFGQVIPTSFVFGQISNTDPDGTTSFVHGVTVCAYDALESNHDVRVPLTLNGKNICNETTESGTFSFRIPHTDLNDSGTPDVAVRVNADNREIIIYKNNNRNLTFIDSIDPQTNIRPNMQTLGIIDISQPNNGKIPIEHQAFWAFEDLVNINEWYQDTLTIHPDKIDVVYDPDICRGVGVDPDSHILTLGADSGFSGKDCINTVHAPISNTDTLAHEYAHFVFLETYDEIESDYPSSIITDSSGFHSPVHENPASLAWLEGWAFFMATAYSGTSTYQPAYMAGQWNLTEPKSLEPYQQ